MGKECELTACAQHEVEWVLAMVARKHLKLVHYND
jgi:hypothetical protein